MPLESDAAYECPWCGERNYVAVDPSGGKQQRFTEDCPVCCHPIRFAAGVDAAGEAYIESAEQE